MTEEIRPNYYRVKVYARAIDSHGNVSQERRASTLVELEVIDLIEALGNHFYIGSAIKHLIRAGKKSPDKLEDLRKAATHAGLAADEVTQLEAKRDFSGKSEKLALGDT